MRPIIVSFSDENYFQLLRGLVLSCRAHEAGREMRIGVLDGGLTAEQGHWLALQDVEVTAAGWDIPSPESERGTPGYRALTARPFLPRYFPGYDTYLWIDADAWIQDWSVVRMYLAAAQTGKIAITPELDRCYPSMCDPAVYEGRYRIYETFFGRDVARRCGYNPTLNSGVFALRGDAPHWDRWAGCLAELVHVTRSFYVEQIALNYAVYAEELPYYLLPAVCNWLCGLALPVYKPANGSFVEPSAPFSRIGIVHLAGRSKARVVRLSAMDGTEIERTLEYLPSGEPTPSRPTALAVSP